MAGLFLTIEGTEGVGKSTNLAYIKTFLERKGIDLVVTREPGGTPLAEEIRGLLLKARSEKVDNLAELLLVFSARAQHIKEVIRPALMRGAWVLSDRFTDATYAYQGYARGLPVDAIAMLETLVHDGLQPDKTFLLNMDVRLGLERARARAELDRFEREEITFFEKVQQGYHARVKQDPRRFAVIDAGHSLGDVQRDITTVLNDLLGV